MTHPTLYVRATRPAEPSLLGALGGRLQRPVPVWLMRQAGRYLPEYRALRARADGFLDFCLTPALAVEASLQPIRRFGLDGAIVFSDILLIPYALGLAVRFEDGQGPLVEPVRDAAAAERLSTLALDQRLGPVWETVAGLKAALPQEVALIGFAGAPWTVATYMVEGGVSRDFAAIRGWAYRDPAGFGRLIDLLVEATAIHLKRQVEAGAQVLQIFESWAGALPGEAFRRWGIEPVARLIAAVKAAHPRIPVIVFPRGAGTTYVDWASESGADAIGLDSGVPLEWAARNLAGRCVLQGNLDPVALVAGGAALDAAAGRILDRLASKPLVFNLGHGVLPQTPPEHVDRLVALVRRWRG